MLQSFSVSRRSVNWNDIEWLVKRCNSTLDFNIGIYINKSFFFSHFMYIKTFLSECFKLILNCLLICLEFYVEFHESGIFYFE